MSDTNIYKARSPMYSLSTRYNVPTDNTNKPGPGAYTAEKVTDTIFLYFVKFCIFLDKYKG